MIVYAIAKYLVYSFWCYVGLRTSARARFAWVLGGLVISFATDAVSPDGRAGRFCVGRCLC